MMKKLEIGQKIIINRIHGKPSPYTVTVVGYDAEADLFETSDGGLLLHWNVFILDPTPVEIEYYEKT